MLSTVPFAVTFSTTPPSDGRDTHPGWSAPCKIVLEHRAVSPSWRDRNDYKGSHIRQKQRQNLDRVGSRNPSVDVVERLAKALDTTPGQLLDTAEGFRKRDE